MTIQLTLYLINLITKKIGVRLYTHLFMNKLVHTEDREKDVQLLVDAVLNISPNFYDNPNGGYENSCPICYKMAYGSGKKSGVYIGDIQHKTDCAYLIAKDLSTK